MRWFAKIQIAAIVTIMAGLLPANAGKLHYQATLEDSRWEATSSPLQCTLTHPVKYFGKAEFYQLAGFQPRFRFFAHQAPIRKGDVSVSSKAPDWKHNTKNRDLGKYTYQRGETPFRFKRSMSLRLMHELEQGMTPVFSFNDWGDGRDKVSAVLSTVRYREGLVKFRECMGQIIPYDYNKVRNTMLHFDSARYTLKSSAKRKLDAVIAYLIRDPSVKKAYVDGHTDNIGTHSYNNELSERRALAVREYLLSQNVPESKLVIKYFGKRQPLKSNRTTKGRSVNRRVRVELVR